METYCKHAYTIRLPLSTSCMAKLLKFSGFLLLNPHHKESGKEFSGVLFNCKFLFDDYTEHV